MRCFLTIVWVALLGSVNTAAGAQMNKGEAEVTEYIFKDKLVEGTLIRPDGAIVPTRKAGGSRSLVKIRGHFVPEMLKSVEDI